MFNRVNKMHFFLKASWYRLKYFLPLNDFVEKKENQEVEVTWPLSAWYFLVGADWGGALFLC